MKSTLLIGVLSVLGVAHAATITLDSSTTIPNNDGTTVLATVDPSWATPLAGSKWITTTGNTNPLDTAVTFTDTFILPTGFTGATLNLGVYADDTASVVLDGTTLFTADDTLGEHCASGPIGCTSGTEGIDTNVNVQSDLHAGSNTLVFTDYQLVANTPFGLDYAGSITYSTATTPEPSSMGLIGMGLMGLAWGLRKARIKAARQAS